MVISREDPALVKTTGWGLALPAYAGSAGSGESSAREERALLGGAKRRKRQPPGSAVGNLVFGGPLPHEQDRWALLDHIQLFVGSCVGGSEWQRLARTPSSPTRSSVAIRVKAGRVSEHGRIESGRWHRGCFGAGDRIGVAGLRLRHGVIDGTHGLLPLRHLQARTDRFGISGTQGARGL